MTNVQVKLKLGPDYKCVMLMSKSWRHGITGSMPAFLCG